MLNDTKEIYGFHSESIEEETLPRLFSEKPEKCTRKPRFMFGGERGVWRAVEGREEVGNQRVEWKRWGMKDKKETD